MNDRQPSIGTRRICASRALRTLVTALGFAAIVLPEMTFAQQGAQQQLAAGLHDEIEAAELRGGPNSTELIDPLTALGQLYQRGGESGLAATAFQQAVNVVRYNYGLHSLDQAPLVRELIANAESVGDRRSAWNLEQELLALAGRYPDDPRTARIFRETGDRRMDLLARYNAGENPPEIEYGCFYTEPLVPMEFAGIQGPSCKAGSSTRAKQNVVKEAQVYYGRAVNVILDNLHYASDELPPLLMQLVESSYRYGNPSLGRRNLDYLLAYRASNEEASARLDTLVQIADWDLMYSIGRDEENAALAEYAQAYRLLEEQDVAQDQIDRTFAPQTPVVLPAFLPNPLVNEPGRESAGHIDIGFEVDEYGRSRHVRIRDTSDDSTRAAERRVLQMVLRSRFRPAFADAQSARPARFVVRYYLND